MFLSYFDWVRGDKLYYINFKPPRSIISRDVVFIESEMLQSLAQSKPTVIKPRDKDQKTYFQVNYQVKVQNKSQIKI